MKNAIVVNSIATACAANHARPSALLNRRVVPNAERSVPVTATQRGAPYARSARYRTPAEAPPQICDTRSWAVAVPNARRGTDRSAGNGG